MYLLDWKKNLFSVYNKKPRAYFSNISITVGSRIYIKDNYIKDNRLANKFNYYAGNN